MFEIPDIDDTVKQIQEWFDSTDFVRNLYKNIKLESWEEDLYEYFSEVYDDLFSDLILKKTFISKDTKKMLEVLATPIYRKSEGEKQKIYKKFEDKNK